MRSASLLATLTLVATFSMPAAAEQRHAKLDESLNDSLARGCKGTKSVIIRTRPGSREAVRNSLAAQGRRVKGEFPALDAISVDVSCADLKAIAAFRETASVSDNATVHGHQLGDLLDEPMDAPVLEEDEGAVSAYSGTSSNTTKFVGSLLSRLTEAAS